MTSLGENMPRGLPRPRVWGEGSRFGMPIPYNVNDEHHLGTLDRERDFEVIHHRICQTCGLHFEEGVTAYGVRQPETAPPGIILDNGLLHWSCLKLALRWCPHLKDLEQKQQLFLVKVQPAWTVLSAVAVRADGASLQTSRPGFPVWAQEISMEQFRAERPVDKNPVNR